MSNSKQPKQTSKVDRMREIIRNTEGNFQEAELGKEFAEGIQREILSEENERRKQSIDDLKEEIKEEIGKSKKGKA